MSAALIRGLQSAGVAATAKHFPGHGDTSSDSHRGAPIVRHNAKRIRSVELFPFRAAVNSKSAAGNDSAYCDASVEWRIE